jgi:hypothetical protein
MIVHCAPPERGKLITIWSYRHLAPLEPGNAYCSMYLFRASLVCLRTGSLKAEL